MATTLIRNAQAIVTVDREDRVLRGENILVQDNVIRYIGPEERPADCVIDASHCFVYPGLVNTHHHLYQTFTRNLPKVQKMELFPWLRTLYEIWRGLDEDCIYYSSLVGLGELLKYGCTTCMDHHYVFPRVGSEHFIDQQFRAADLLGVRFHATRGSMSRGKSDGGLPPDDLVQDVDTILRDSQRLVEKFHDTSRFSMHQVALAPCSPFSVTTDLLKQSAVLARSMGVRLHTHLCETKDEERFTLEAVGMRPLAYMESCGWLGEDVWYAHGIHFNGQELRLLAQTGTGVAHCPVSNMKLASGVCRVPDMLELGDFSQQGHYEVGSYARERGVELLVAVGPLAKGIAAGYGSEAHWFATNEEATAFLQEALHPGDAVLVKGSRGMRTDEIVAALTAGQEA